MELLLVKLVILSLMQSRNYKNRILAYVCLVCFSAVPMFVSAKTIMIVGDSLSAGYGIQVNQGWVSLFKNRLEQQYPKKHKVVNVSVSGETTSGAVARLPKLLATHKPDIVVIELGGNDGLRGQPPQLIQKNLAQLVLQSQKTKAQVILLGMKMPPNYGTAYQQAFENNYKIVSNQYKVKLMPFFLKDVAGHKDLMQKDQIHPNAKAQPILLNNTYPYIKGAL